MKKYFCKTFIYACFFSVCLSVSMSFYSCQNIRGTVSVDFQKKENVKSMLGFLHFNDITKFETDLKELKPQYWKFRWVDSSVQDVNYLLKYGVKPIVVISDKYGYPDDPNWKSPLKSNRFKNITQEIYLAVGNKVIYDPWNEPYLTGFGGSFSVDFYEAFKQAHDVIRSLPGGKDAMIIGPSFHHYNKGEIEAFLKFCKENKVRLDILCWHDWRYGEDIKNLQDDIAEVKNEVLPKYPAVGVKEIVLSEIIHGQIQFSPTQIYKLYDGLEKSKLDGGSRSCFDESTGISNCENDTMGGLLDKNGKRRSVWWATKLYSQSINNRVFSSTDQENLISFASYDKNNAYLLLANNYNKTIEETNITLSNIAKLPNFKKSKTVTLNIYKVPTTGEKPLDKPIFISSKKINISKQNLQFKIQNINSQEIYYFVFSK